MGLAALATIPIYMETFDVMALLVDGFQPSPRGHLIFNLSRYALCLAVMLPATALAGMTLPVITAMMLLG